MRRFRDQTAQVEILLIEGNHDILHPELYRQLDILLLPELKEMGCLFTHEPYPDEETGDWVNVCGHIHPAIRMVGKGRQSLRLPCYYRTETQFILPAFGYFTGMSLVRKKANSSIFAIAGEEIFSV